MLDDLLDEAARRATSGGLALLRMFAVVGPAGGVERASLHEAVEHWYLDLCRDDSVTATGIADAIDQLAVVGPALGRPLVDRIHGSRHHNMKERDAIPIADERFTQHLKTLQDQGRPKEER